jgi:glycosyltransferase involved in cell wall biosynthesis
MSNSTLSVSVVMATYNGDKFLAAQLDSIIQQTMPADEVLIIDDCSTDGTVEIIRAYQQLHGNIRLLLNSSNQGSNRTFEAALHSSKGDLIFISDQDDIWIANKVETMVNDWEVHRAGLTCSDGCIIDQYGVLSAPSELTYIGQKKILQSQESLFFANCYSGHNMMLSRDFIELAQPFPAGPIYDHWLAVVACGLGQLRYLPIALTQHRIHDHNQVNGANKSRPRKSKRARFQSSRNALYYLAKAVISLPGEQPAKPLATLLLKHSSASHTILSFATFLNLLRMRKLLFPNDPLKKQLRKIKNYSLGPLGYFL